MLIDESTLEEGHNPCPSCQAQGRDSSGDNLMYYGEGLGYFCFGGCGLVKVSDEYKELNNEDSNKPIKPKGEKILSKDYKKDIEGKALTPEEIVGINKNTLVELPKNMSVFRGIERELYKEAGVRWIVNNENKPTHMYVPVFVKGSDEPTGYHIRRINPNNPTVKPENPFRSVGYVGGGNLFFGQTNATEKTLIICGGQIDALTVKQMLSKDKYNKSVTVVSTNIGEANTVKTIASQYDWVDSHEKIIICMDNDEAGELAYEAIKGVLDNDKLFKANLRHKDPNKYLELQDSANLNKDVYWQVTPVKNYGVLDSKDLFKLGLESVRQKRIPLPPFLKGLKPLFPAGIKLSEILNIVSSVSTGKTVFVNAIVDFWLENCHYKPFIFSLEDSGGDYLVKLASRMLGLNINNIVDDNEREAALLENQELIEGYLVDEHGMSRFNIMDKPNGNLEDMKKAILQAIRVHSAKIILIDPLHSLLPSDLEQQSQWMKFEEETRRNYDVMFLNIVHTRKSNQGSKAHSEGGNITEEDTKGSGQISATATINITLSRNKLSDNPIERNTTYLSVKKNRTSGTTGDLVAKVYYSPEFYTLCDFPFAEKHNFFSGMTSKEFIKLKEEHDDEIVDASKDLIAEEELNRKEYEDGIVVLDSF